MNTKEDILKNDWNFGTIDFHSIFFLLWKSVVPNNCLVPIRRKKLIQVCLQQL